MALTAGTRLGPYEIADQLGAGGMGEVYRATDTRLDRTVAIKVLPEHLASDPQRRERFEREARAVSSLNHPHICTLHDIGEQDGIHYLVMEYVEGDTLQQRLEKGRLPLEQALEYAIQIADALDKAHRQGVVHRDLKPCNIMITKSGTKLLDFGLAKLKGDAGEVSALSQMPTQDPSAPLTAEGTIIGTLQYMAPEQLEGKEADARTDIFAFGAVVYEMVTGKKAFEGASQASLIGSIMNHQPTPVSEVQPVSPPMLDHVVKACLAKNAEDRCQNAGDLVRELRWVASTAASDSVEGRSVTQTPASGRLLPWTVAVVMFAIAAILGWNLWRAENSAVAPVSRLAIPLPEGQRLTGSGESHAAPIAVSPDGSQIVYAATEGGLPRLYRRHLDQFDAVVIPGTEGATSPLYSPDGRWIAFHANGRLQRVPLEGGPPVTICEAPNFRGTGMDWTANDEILFTASALRSGLFRVPVSGGTPQQLKTLDVDRGEYAHSWPQLLPDGRHVLFSVWKAGDRAAILSLDTLEWHEILPDAGGARFLPTGHIVYRTALGSVEARAFDADRLEIVGDSVPLADGIDVIPRAGSFSASVSAGGVLAFVPADPRERTLVWVNRQGQSSEITSDRGSYEFPRVSPDGTRVSFQEGEGDCPRGFSTSNVERGPGSPRLRDSTTNPSGLPTVPKSHLRITGRARGICIQNWSMETRQPPRCFRATAPTFPMRGPQTVNCWRFQT